MKKRILAGFLCFVTVIALAACGGSNVPSGDSAGEDTDTISLQSSKKTDKNTDKNTDTEEKVGYDPTVDHKFLACDIVNHSIVVFDLDACNGDLQKLRDDDVAVVWEWDSDDDPNCRLNPGYGLDSAKYRYSPYYKKDVVIACSSNGWVGIIDYEAKSLLWERRDQITYNAHSVELLPNGDLVVSVSSDPGALVYYAVSLGIDEHITTVNNLWGHGVSWDPVNECLWTLESGKIVAVSVLDMGTKDVKLVRIERSFAEIKGSGHALSPVTGQPGKYWISASSLWQFDTETEEICTNFPLNAFLTRDSIKGICSFADGTVIETVAGIGNNTQSWSSNGFLIVSQDAETKEVNSEYVVFDHRDFYKIYPFSKDYQ